MDRFDSLKAFVTVCETGGFAPAARRLGLSPSAITRQVAALEDALGTRLLQRTTRAVGLTEAGQRYLARAQHILSDLAEADQLAKNEAAVPMGRLSLTAPLIFGRLHVAPVLDRFLRLHPDMSADLHLSDRNRNLIDEGHDMAIRIGHLGDSSMVARRLGWVRRVLAASPDYVAHCGMPAHPAELADHDIIAFTGVGVTVDWHFQEAGREVRVTVSPRYTSNSGDAAIGQALAGGGIVNAFSYQVGDLLACGDLIEILPTFSPALVPIQAVYPSGRLLPARVRAFIDLIPETADWNLV